MMRITLLIALVGVGCAAAESTPATVDPSGTIAHALLSTKLQGRSLHRLLDVNRDNQLSPDEAASFLHQYAAGVYTAFDANSDRQLSVDELRAAQPDRRVVLATEIIRNQDAAQAAGSRGTGSAAVLTVGRQRAYIRDYSVGGNGNLDPEIGVLTVGTQLAVRRIVVIFRDR